MRLKSAPILAVAAVVLAGCGGGGKSESLAPVTKAPSGLSAEASGIAEAAARQFADDVRAGRADAVSDRFDLGAFVRGVCIGTGSTKSVRQDFEAGFKQGLSQRPGGLMAEYMTQEFRFLRLFEMDGSTQMLFRVWDEEAGVDYLRCAFDKADADGWKIVDVYSFTAGEPFTESVRRTYMPVLVSGEKASELRAQFEPLGDVVQKLDEGDHRGARRALLALSEELRGQRFARILKLGALSGIEDAADDYAAAVEAFEKDFPDDPSLPLRMLEVHSIRGEHAEALRRIDQIEALLGGDEFLHFLRVQALVGLDRGATAIEGLKKAIAASPEIEALRWALVSAALPELDFATVGETLRALRQNFEYQLGVDDLEGADEYREFVASEEGKALLAELRAGAPEEAGAGDCK